MSIFQVIATIFALFMLYVVSIHRRKETLSKLETSFWYSVWGFFVVIALFPNFLLGITQLLHFQRVFDLLIVGAFMILSAVVFLSYFKLKNLEDKLERATRKFALGNKSKNE